MNQSCGAVIQEDEVVLTRERMAKTPPDLVFTTTEMLNRSMGTPSTVMCSASVQRNRLRWYCWMRCILTPGIHGAQVAYLLRRWQKVINKKVQFTGLSATLQSAEEFLPNSRVFPLVR
jgi:Lhr-like helicase